MSTTATFTNGSSLDSAFDMVERINEAYADGQPVKVAGREVVSWGNRPATTWTNGTVSFDVRTKRGGGITDLWVKVGQSVTVEIG